MSADTTLRSEGGGKVASKDRRLARVAKDTRRNAPRKLFVNVRLLRELFELFLLLGGEVAGAKAACAFTVDLKAENSQVRRPEGDRRVALCIVSLEVSRLGS